MASKNRITGTRIILNVGFLLAFLFPLFLNPTKVLANGESVPSLPDFSSFAQSVANGNADTIRGVYVSGVLADPIVQQPSDSAAFVSVDASVITQFNMAAQLGNIGLLAHDTLAGAAFSQLVPGEEVQLIYGDGRIENFTVTQRLAYQALDPFSATSDFRDLSTNQTLTAGELFGLVYRGDRHVTFQTCIEQNGNSSWGRLFVIAQPAIVFDIYAGLKIRMW